MSRLRHASQPSAGFIDLHSHLLPGVDDGARHADDVREALRVLSAEKAERVVATPHLAASTLARPSAAARRLTELDLGWRLLERVRAELAGGAERGGSRIPAVARGTELRLDAPDPDLSDRRVRLDGGRAVLVEFPSPEIPVYGGRQLAALVSEGWLPVLAHVERYVGLGPGLERAARWREAGVALQVNAGSLAGRYGAGARRRARGLLERGWASLLASDYHARGAVGLGPARRALLEGDGGPDGEADEAARLLLAENPRRVLAGKPPLPVPPVRLAGGLGRWLGR